MPCTTQAQLSKIFVASTGNDANDGSRGSPKRNFQAAHNAVAAGGQIVVLDTAGYGGLSINKSVSVTVPPGVNGFVTVLGSSNGIVITTAPSDTVVLRGLIVEGGGSGSGGGTGIIATSVGRLTVDDCAVRNFTYGIYLLNTNGGHLLVHGGSVRNTQIGIEVRAVNSGVALDGLVTNCAVDSASQAALFVMNDTASTVARLTAVGCTLTNSGNGLLASGNTSTLFADACTVSGNATDVAIVGGAAAFSRGNNVCTNNTATGSFSGTLPGK